MKTRLTLGLCVILSGCLLTPLCFAQSQPEDIASIRGSVESADIGDNGDSVKYMAVVMDRTGSMQTVRSTGNTRGEDALAAAKIDVVQFFQRVPNGLAVVTTFAGSNFDYLTSGFVGETDAMAALDTLNGQPCNGMTPLADAIQIFCDYLEANAPSAPQDYRIMAVYTDGEENYSTGPCSGPNSNIGPPPAGNYDPGSWQKKCWDYCLDKHTINVVYWGQFRNGDGDDVDLETGGGGNRAISDTVFFQDLSKSNGGTYTQCGDNQALLLGLNPDQPIAGLKNLFTVTLGTPNVETYLAYSTSGPGSTNVPFLNVTLDLAKPKQAGGKIIADSSGTAVWNLTFPPNSAGADVWFQAVQYGMTSNTVNPTIIEDVSGQVYKYDDGSVENLWGWSAGGDMCWMHRFDAVTGGETILDVRTIFGSLQHPGWSPGNGTACEVFVWDDPTNDGDPSDCVLLTREPTTVQNVDTDIMNVVTLSTPVTVSGVFFVGCVLTHSTGQYVMPTDETTTYVWGDAFYCGTNTAGAFDPYNLVANPAPPAEIGNYWCLRAGF